MQKFLTFLAFPLGAILPWISLFLLVYLAASKNQAWNSVGVVTTSMFAAAGCLLMFVIAIIVSFFISSQATWVTRFAWGVGISIAAIFLGWFSVMQKQKTAMQSQASRQEARAALIARKDPKAPAGSTQSFFGELVMIRPLEGQWMFRAPHTQVAGEPASTMGVFNARIEAFWPAQGTPRGLLGRIDDEGDLDVDGMWVTIVKQSPKDINLTKTQRYNVWIERQKPSDYQSDGTPIHKDGPSKNAFWGTADIVADSAYKGYDPNEVEL